MRQDSAMMPQEIPCERWPDTLNVFARLHHGKPAQIELIDANGNKHRYSDDQPLLGVAIERRGGNDEVLTVMWGGPSQGVFSHSVSNPSRLSMVEWNDAYSARLEIQSRDQQRLTIQVGPVEQLLAPGMITDGVLLENPP
jgi:hypothetical protein